ncbi:hypothetical protein [Crossiella cryophila]|uniref:Uncharacterized protein n=1 Tax=Crossiella cryophila TaxID=43355 RepID=A0A7W7CED7_9PSEU|nr:hypothetical protein [Crossiella cryophila]MBB4678004.1 hypothetical protein [Crossiella cryophila]
MIRWSATLWSALYALVALGWVLGAPGYPFGPSDPAAHLSPLGGVPASTSAPLLAIGMALAAAIALLMSRGVRTGRPVLLTLAWLITAVLALVLNDGRVLMLIGYLPIVLVGGPLGLLPVSAYLDKFDGPNLNQFALVLGVLLWLAATLDYQRRTADACLSCGVGPRPMPRWARPEVAARWGKWCAYLAFLVPLAYAVTRWAWFGGFTLGLISEEFLREGQQNGLWIAGAGLGTFAAAGGLLTLGLVYRWGEVYPFWVPGLRGKRVSPLSAIIPASVVAVIVTAAGMGVFVGLVGRVGFSEFIVNPMTFFPFWGLALGAATVAYFLRRRVECGRHEDRVLVDL